VPAFCAGLADVGRPGAEREQALKLGFLVAVGGVNVDVQAELAGPRVAARAEDEGGLQAAEAGVGRASLQNSASRSGSAQSMTSSLMRFAMRVSVWTQLQALLTQMSGVIWSVRPSRALP
jgi:hypothetical protein